MVLLDLTKYVIKLPTTSIKHATIPKVTGGIVIVSLDHNLNAS